MVRSRDPFLDFGDIILVIPLEQMKIDISNLVCRLIVMSTLKILQYLGACGVMRPLQILGK